MQIELSNTQELRTQLSAIDSFSAYLQDVAEENPERVYIFANRLKKAIEEIEKKIKDRAIIYQETHGELGAGYSLRVSQRASYKIDSPEYLIAKNKLKEIEETEKIKIDLEEKEKGMSDKKSYSQIYSFVAPKI
jgi:hypothetical protein